MSDVFDPEHFHFVPISEATQPLAGRPRCYVNHYWLVDDQERIAFYNPRGRNGRRRDRGYGAAQANTSPRIGELLRPRYPWCVRVELLPVVFAPETYEDAS